MYHLRRITITASSLGALVFVLWFLPRVLNPTPPTPDEKRRDKDWVDTSPYWLDRQSCRWLGLCGVHHVRPDPPALPDQNGTDDDEHDLGTIELRSLFARSDSYKWLSRESLGDESWEIAGRQPVAEASAAESSSKTSVRREIPDYVLDYAPLVHLFSGENFWPSHIAEHVKHMIPYTNGSVIDYPHPITLDNLHLLNNHSTEVFLTSEVDIETRPEWLHSHDGIPVPFDENDDGDSNDGDNAGGDRDNKNGHDHERPKHQYPDDTTWFDVDKDHPLNRISDPRKLPTPPRKSRSLGPQDMRARQLRQQVLSNDDSNEEQVVIAAQEPLGSVHGYKPDESGYSKGPAILVMVDKGSGIVDAFWFFFYSYNLGQTVLKVRYGNHVGDWEHCMIRFENGVPRALFLSEHAGGQAYAWNALEKFKPKRNESAPADAPAPPERPVIYSAVGSHAMYALPGTHPYVLPFQMLRDETDKGPLWDPAKNNLAYFYDYVKDREEGGGGDDGNNEEGDAVRDTSGTTPAAEPTSLTPAASNPDAPTSWFHYRSWWGDETYELGDKRQWRLFGQYHYITGPDGPKFKNLGREKVCQTARCRILYSLAAGKKASWYS